MLGIGSIDIVITINIKQTLKKILIIEDEVVVAKSIGKILSNNGYGIVGFASNYKEAKEKLLTSNPDLILCDINLNDSKTGIDLMNEFDAKFNVPFIFITAYTDDKTISEAEKLQPQNYLTKPFSEKQLLVSVERVFRQQRLIGSELPTNRELSILKFIGKGLSTKQIAEELSISFNTVESHRKNLMKKYEVNSMAELVCLATSKGWISYVE